MQPIVATGRVEQGALVLRNRKQLDAALRRWRDGDVTVTIERLRATRSHKANRYYWGVVLAVLSDHTGFTPEELHEWAKCKFLPKRRAMCDGNGVVVDEYVIGGSTTKLDSLDFGEYVTRIKEFAAADLGVTIPEANEDAI